MDFKNYISIFDEQSNLYNLYYIASISPVTLSLNSSTSSNSSTSKISSSSSKDTSKVSTSISDNNNNTSDIVSESIKLCHSKRSSLYAKTSQVNGEDKREKFYITTAINYTNGPAHMGHAYEAVLSDVIARYQRSFGNNVFFLTGTDEHGQKVEKSALALGKNPQDHCDFYAAGFKALDETLDISFDRFVRTTEPAHKELAKKVWLRVRERGDIYLKKYEGWYNIYEEQYVTETEAKKNDFKDEHGRPYERKSEESYFFRMSKYQGDLIKLFNENIEACQPEERRQEILKFLEEPLNDLCISRTICKWGVPCPYDPDYKGENTHVMYVWFDALSNYLTGVDYLVDGSKNSEYWPANVHIIGKDITRFHCVYWPAMLLSAGIPLPKCVFGHGFVTAADGQKMSKSLGNVVDPVDILTRVPRDSFRFYLCHGAVFGSDMPFSEKALTDIHNGILIKDLGNLLNRVLTLLKKFCDSKIPEEASYSIPDKPKESPYDLEALKNKALENISIKGGFNVRDVCHEAVEAISKTNKYLAALEPWAMKKEEEKPLQRSIIKCAIEAIYAAVLFLAPIIPDGAERILKQIGAQPMLVIDLSPDFNNLVPGTKLFSNQILYPEFGDGGKLVSPLLNVDNLINDSENENEEHKSKVRTEHIKNFNKTGLGEEGWLKAREEKRKKEEENRLKQANARSSKNTASSVTDEAAIPVFGKIELRVGQIVKVWNHPDAEKLYCEEIDVGDKEGPRPIASGLRDFYTLEQMQGRKVIVVCNLKPRDLVKFESKGMVLCAKSEGKVEFIDPPNGSAVGERINLEDLDILNFEPLPPNQISKKKVWEELAKNLSTDENCNATWDGHKLVTKSGICKSITIKNSPIS